MTITCPDILFVVQQISQFMQAPRHHLVVVRSIIQYLKGTSPHGFFPKESSLQLVGYSNTNWVGCANTRHIVTSWCMFLENALIY